MAVGKPAKTAAASASQKQQSTHGGEQRRQLLRDGGFLLGQAKLDERWDCFCERFRFGTARELTLHTLCLRRSLQHFSQPAQRLDLDGDDDGHAPWRKFAPSYFAGGLRVYCRLPYQPLQ